uniref:Galectin n=1 Tax=Pogona vitticeps TaxID=103695 RepID=A0ABM5EN37_9SAUR
MSPGVAICLGRARVHICKEGEEGLARSLSFLSLSVSGGGAAEEAPACCSASGRRVAWAALQPKPGRERKGRGASLPPSPSLAALLSALLPPPRRPAPSAFPSPPGQRRLKSRPPARRRPIGQVSAALRTPPRLAMAFQTPFFRPSLPFTGPIYGGLKDGMMVLVCGSVLHSCERFQIDFQCGCAQSPRPDIAFHFNPRFNERCVVSNSFERGSWQREERKQDLPFRKGHPFEIRILVNSSSFMVAVDGKHYLEFKHRIPLNRVDTIGISGGLEVASISFQGPATNSVFPSNPVFPPGYPQNTPFPPGPYFPPQNYPVPFRMPIVGGLFPSRSIILSGTVPPNATRFHVNLKAGSNTAFQLNPRFNENVIVRNSKFNDCWGSEERNLSTGMPFSRNQAFTIWIMCETHCFKVAVNGQHLFDYNHRFPNLQQIDQLEVEGDVTLTNVQA